MLLERAIQQRLSPGRPSPHPRRLSLPSRLIADQALERDVGDAERRVRLNEATMVSSAAGRVFKAADGQQGR